MNRSSKALLAVALVAFVAAFLAMPMLTVRALIAAAKSGDEAALERLVDFPAFRDSAKTELTARLMGEMSDDPRSRDSALGGLGMMLAPMLVGGAVDALVTAPNVAAMVRTAEMPDPMDTDTTPRAADEAVDDLRKGYGYRDLNTFVLTLTDPARPTGTLKLLLKRQGLFGWKLAGIDLPEARAEPAP